LFLETTIGLHAASLLSYTLERLIEAVPVLLHDVADKHSGATTDACGAVHQHIGLLALFLNELVGLLEVVGYLLAFTVVQGKLNLLELWWVLKAQVHSGTDAKDFVLAQLGDVVREVIAANPDRPEAVFSW